MPSTAAWTARRSALGEDLVRGIDRRARRAVGQGDVGDPGGRHHRSSAKRARRPSPTSDDDHRDREDREDERVGGDAEPQTEAAEQRTGEDEQERDAHDVHDRGVAGQEPGEVRPGPDTGPPRDRTRGSRRAGCRAPTAPGSRGSARRTAAPAGRRATAGCSSSRLRRQRLAAFSGSRRGRRQLLSEPPPVAHTSAANAPWAIAVASSRSSIATGQADQPRRR